MYFLFVLLAVLSFSGMSHAHKHDEGKALPDDVKIEKLSDNLSVVQAGGGNIAVFHGDDGVFIVDNGLEDKREVVQVALNKVMDEPARYLVNTHWHYDHAGNNKMFGNNGKTILLAHDNVRKRLKTGGTVKAFDKKVAPAHQDALPVLTYEDGVNVYLNKDIIKIHTVDPAHTDGDSFIVFSEQNIIHTGDLFFNGFWPFIDASSKGSIQGVIKAIEEVLIIADENTKIIPGHGPVASKADLQSYRDMLVDVAARVKKMKEGGQSKEQWVKSNPLADLDKKWGKGFLPTAKFTEIVWDVY